jgi:hypothetical protein
MLTETKIELAVWKFFPLVLFVFPSFFFASLIGLSATIKIEDVVTSFMMVKVEVSVVQGRCSNWDSTGCMWFVDQDLTLPRLVDC